MNFKKIAALALTATMALSVAACGSSSSAAASSPASGASSTAAGYPGKGRHVNGRPFGIAGQLEHLGTERHQRQHYYEPGRTQYGYHGRQRPKV